jgi:hypothetical protein
MRGTFRLGIGASAVFLALGAPVTVEAVAADPGVSVASADLGLSVARNPEPDNASATSESEDNPLRPVIGLGAIVIVFVIGLRAVKRQRDEGRRSKLPPIG